MYAKIKDSTLVTYPYGWGQFVADNPYTNYGQNTDFVTLFPSTTLGQEGYTLVAVTQVTQPTIDPITQDIAEGTPIVENGVWTQVWNVTQASSEEIAQRQTDLANANKAKAQKLLQETDWTEIPSVSNTSNLHHLVNAADFVTYRIALRVIAINPTYNATFPTIPTEQWT